jgi:hypothetical protein
VPAWRRQYTTPPTIDQCSGQKAVAHVLPRRSR